MATRRLAFLLVASVCALAAGAITAWWAVAGAYGTAPYALAFLIAGGLLISAAMKQSVRLAVVALALTAFAELAPLGGLTASALLRAPIPWLGSVLPLCAGATSIAGTAVFLLSVRSSSRSS